MGKMRDQVDSLDKKRFHLRCCEAMDEGVGVIAPGSAWSVEIARMETAFTLGRFINEVRNELLRIKSTKTALCSKDSCGMQAQRDLDANTFDEQNCVW
jgi:hypothetical protein